MLLAFASPPAWPAYAGFLNGTPMSQLDQKDIDALNSTVQIVLNTKNDGETTPWIRPASGDRAEVSATLTPEGTSIKHHRTCRFVAVTIHAGDQAFKLRPQYCQSAKTTWKLQGAQ
ncbi:hypothetical protein ACFSHT_30340 [Paraburkholderia silviterrae]|uniref:Surface antigen domain-containing protein n=1 Tax=Paraburkholderia silviterrae TaxID=2528715 RepID=A0A4R5LYC8_9BURK|nr:hypothetical protein [Paraburkholderia silviterrae]TDG17274.1 hypothetical protein EYW47_38305 [Paraburkholderia silviterrae]